MIISIIVVVVLALLAVNIRVVPQTSVFVIERLGKFKCEWNAGIHVKMPFIDKVVRKVSIKEQVLDFPPQAVITKDNVTMSIDSIVFMKVTDPKLYTYGVENPIIGVENLAATTLRNLVGAMDFDATLTSRDAINNNMEVVLDEATDAWGIKVTRVEVKNIQPPAEIQEVMTKQMKAEREKRQAILEAEAHKQSIVTRAEGDKAAKVLAAEAESEAKIALAKGQAESIRLVYEAEAKGIERMNEANISASVLKLKSIEALKDVANGNSTKIFMPTDVMETVASMGVIGEALGVGEHTPAMKKENPAKRPLKDACLNEDSSSISVGAARAGYEMQDDLQAKAYDNERTTAI